jgi:hypothetical protein
MSICKEKKMKYLKIQFLFFMFVLFLSQGVFAQEKVITPDLTKIISGDGWQVVNRDPEIVIENGYKCIYFKANNQQGGIAWLENFEFTNGVIEVDIKGKNVKGGSFLGVVFRGLNDSTYDAVYFRPFNFDSAANMQGHSVQYISHPQYTWYSLRKEHPGQYENSVNPVPKPDKFFHAKIVVEKPKVSVYVGNSAEPSLVVNELSERTGGRIGLWMDFISDGTFANLKITPAKD